MIKNNALPKRCIQLILLLFFLSTFLSNTALSLTFPLPAKGDSVVGENKIILAQPGDTFDKIAQRYDVGFYELIEANPTINPDFIFVGERVVIPTRFILPNVPRKGLVINLDELRLYYYPPNKGIVITFPVGIGREGWDTPTGKMSIIQKRKNPTWYAPESIRKARLENDGVVIPKVIPPGPDNPLGKYAMRLSLPSYLIHGTNDPSGVGRRASSGCIRLYPDDIEQLYEITNLKTSVNIIRQPYKVGWQGDKLYVEAHLPLQEDREKYTTDRSILQGLLRKATQGRTAFIDSSIADAVTDEQIGMPMLVGGSNLEIEALAKHNFTNRERLIKGYKTLPSPFSSARSHYSYYNYAN